MAENSEHRERVERVARQMSGAIRRQARRRWDMVRTTERNESGRHVWRFRSVPRGGELYLHVTHEAMGEGDDAAPRLLEQLRAGRLFSRLSAGPATALVLGKEGRLETYDA